MTPASLVIAAALVAWGPALPAPEPPAPGDAGDAVVAPSDGAATPEATATPAPAPATPPEPAPTPPAQRAPAWPPSAAPAFPAPIIAKAPLDVRGRPMVAAAPPPHKPVHTQWAFWVLAGSFLAGTLVALYVATRPEPQAYRGNAPPYYIPFP